MTTARFTISAFGDEIAEDLESQLHTLNDLQISHLELRAAWGVNVLYLSDAQVADARRLCDAAGVTVSCIGSPIGKSPLADPIEKEMSNLERIIEVGRALGTRNIRIFSFYPPDTSSNAHYDQHVSEAAARLARLAGIAAREDVALLLENEKDIVGDTPQRCLSLLQQVDSPHLRFIWDPANFVQVGVARQVDDHWAALSPYIAYIHIKDAMLADGQVKAAGEGDGQVRELLLRLRDSGYQGVLALEPHLAVAGHSGGFSGVDGMTYAVGALRDLLDSIGQRAN
jgi:sugar phosphate isomerase/epimerase